MMIDLNDEGHDLRLIKNVELNVLRNELAVRNEILSVKKKELKEKRKELDNINYDIWNTQDRFCDEIWNFSSRHNFNKLFNQYPDGTQIIEPHECKYNSVIDEGAGKTDIQLKLKQEIDIINNELILVRKNNVDVEDDLKRCRVTLDNLVSFSEEALKLIRSINAISAADNSLSISNTKENEKSPNEGFYSARRLLLNESGFRNCVLTETNYVSTNITGEINKQDFNIRNTTVKHRVFVMKKRSKIALKYEKNKVGDRQ